MKKIALIIYAFVIFGSCFIIPLQEAFACYGHQTSYCRDMGGLGMRCYLEGSPDEPCCSTQGKI